MPNDSFSQLTLAGDSRFRLRFKAALLTIAEQVLGEDPATVNHAARLTFANNVIRNPENFSSQLAPYIVFRPNVLNFATSYDFAQGAFVTAAGDADLDSQVATDWNWLAAL